MSEGITGKVVVITSGSSGLGEATGRHLAARGAKVVLSARRQDRLVAVAADIKAAGGVAVVVTADVTVKRTWTAASRRLLGPSAVWTCSSTTPASWQSRRCRMDAQTNGTE